jgi:hypothetical protein
MGILWTSSFFYILLALVLILIAYNQWLNFHSLLLFHVILLFLLSTGIYFSYYVNKYTHEIRREENNIQQMLIHINLIDSELGEKGDKELKEELSSLRNELNNLLPSSDSDVIQLDEHFIDEASRVLMIIQTNYSGDYNAIKFNLNKCKRILDERKKYFLY